jgi:hypothetical protein
MSCVGITSLPVEILLDALGYLVPLSPIIGEDSSWTPPSRIHPWCTIGSKSNTSDQQDKETYGELTRDNPWYDLVSVRQYDFLSS